MPRYAERVAGALALVTLLLYCTTNTRRPTVPISVRVHRRRPLRLETGDVHEDQPMQKLGVHDTSSRRHVSERRRGLDSALNLDNISDLRKVIDVADGRELILTTSDWNGVGSAVNLARQLARFSLDRRLLLLADNKRTCSRASTVWSWLVCGYSLGIPGFQARYASLGMPLVDMWNLWSAKWLVLARLCELGLNVMMMDSDILVLADPYRLLLSSPLSQFALILPPEGERVNVGYLYARGAGSASSDGDATQDQPPSSDDNGALHSLLWDVVRRLRLFIELQTLTDRRGQPSVSGLWDQGVFSDALLSSVRGELTYPFTWLHSPSAFAGVGPADGTVAADTRIAHRGSGGPITGWPPAGFTQANATTLWRSLWRRGGNAGLALSQEAAVKTPDASGHRPSWLFPSLPPAHPQIRDWSVEHPLLWNTMRLNDPTASIPSALAASRPDLLPGWVRRLHWVEKATRPSERGSDSGTGSHGASLVAAAPDWLHCTTGHWMMTAGWLSADKPVCAILHLVESRSQFAHFASLDTLKANRPYVMRSYGHWHEEASRHLEDRGKPPHAKALRAVRLGADILSSAATSTGLGVLLNALQILAHVAALTRRTPVIPSVPCTSRWLKRHLWTSNGIADDYILQLPRRTGGSDGSGFSSREPRDGFDFNSSSSFRAVACHLSIGGAGCSLPLVLPAWHPLSDSSAGVEGLPAMRLEVQGRSAADLRARAEELRDVPVLEISLEDTKDNENYRRFKCGNPVTLVEGALLDAESGKLIQLQRACPAFFAPRGKNRRQLDWLHRRRSILADEAGCAEPT